MITIKASQKTKEVLVKIPGHLMRHKKALEKSLHEIGDDVVKETVRLIKSPPKTGIHYPDLPNRSSAPGEAPANQSGDLAKSVDYIVRSPYEMTVGEEMEYGKFLEDGTRRMKPRPHLIKAIQNKSQDGVNTILTNIDREING
jgi:hypothetical protein